MTARDYKNLATIVGETLAVAYSLSSDEPETIRTEIYDALYRPIVAMLQADNERFDNLKFAWYVGITEQNHINNLTAARR